jgi:hypothetical protein
MTNEVKLADEYRKHAKALRAAAAFEEDANTSAVLKKVANRFEDVANEIEGAEATNRAGVDPHRTVFTPTNKPGDGQAP